MVIGIRVLASDSDAGSNARLSYFIYPETQNFAIDSNTGIVTAKSVFDREVINLFSFRVFAKDNGLTPLTGSATVIVNINDINDNPPVFSKNSYEFQLMKSVPIGKVIGHVTAYDADTGDNANVSLSLSVSKNISTVPFEISSDGIIRTVKTLERETESKYSFRVMAIDHGQPRMQSFASVTVHVLDGVGQTLIG